VFYQWLYNGVEYEDLSGNGSLNPTIIVGTVGQVITCRVSMTDVNGTGSTRVITSNSCTVTA
jgi:hypothetical protein